MSRRGVLDLSAHSLHIPIFQSAKMNESELEDVLKSLNSALKVYYNSQTTLSALEISIKSMLMVLHAQVAEQLQEIQHAQKSGGTNT